MDIGSSVHLGQLNIPAQYYRFPNQYLNYFDYNFLKYLYKQHSTITSKLVYVIARLKFVGANGPKSLVIVV